MPSLACYLKGNYNSLVGHKSIPYRQAPGAAAEEPADGSRRDYYLPIEVYRDLFPPADETRFRRIK